MGQSGSGWASGGDCSPPGREGGGWHRRRKRRREKTDSKDSAEVEMTGPVGR